MGIAVEADTADFEATLFCFVFWKFQVLVRGIKQLMSRFLVIFSAKKHYKLMRNKKNNLQAVFS